MTAFIEAADKFTNTRESWTDVPLRSEMDNWVAARSDKTQRDIKVVYYDDRGNVQATELMNGAANGGVDRTSEGWISWSYDQSGRLTGQTPYGRNATGTSYDVLGRVTASTDANGGTTSFAYQAGGATVVVTLASGLIQTLVNDATGALVSYTESGTATAGGTSAYAYDRRGLLRRVTDATGKLTWYLYDQYGRKIAQVVSLDGTLTSTRITEFKYDKTGRPIAIVRYEGAVRNTSSLNSFTTDPGLASLRPVAAPSDRWDWRIYDAEGRLLEAVDGDGVAIAYSYDGSGQLIRTRRFANALTAAQIAGFTITPPTAVVLPQPDTDRDTNERIFYDAAGRVTGTLDAAGYLVETTYDGGGRKIGETACASATVAAQRAAGSLATLKGGVSGGVSRTTRWVYDGRGNLRFAIDALGHVTEYDYHSRAVDQNGRTYADLGQLQRTIAYDGAIGSLGSYTVVSVAAALASGGANSIAQKSGNRTSIDVYDVAGRVAYAIDAGGTVVRYTYDVSGNVLSATTFKAQRPGASLPLQSEMDSWVAANADPSLDRTTRYWYDARGELRYVANAENCVTETLYDAEGRLTTTSRYANRLNGNPAMIAAVSSALGTSAKATSTIAYDGRGLVSDMVDANGTRTTYAYTLDGKCNWEVHGYGTDAQTIVWRGFDAAGRLIDEYTAFGSSVQRRTHYEYDGFGNLVAKTEANGARTLSYYDKLGQLIATRDAASFVTTTSYNAFGEAVQSTRSFVATTSPIDPKTSPTVVADARDVKSYSYYDAFGQAIAVQDAEGYFTEIGYDSFGDTVSVTRHAIAITLGAPLSAVFSDSRYSAQDDVKTLSYYDKQGQLSVACDAEGYVTEYRCNASGDLVCQVRRANPVANPSAANVPQPIADPLRDEYTYTYYDELGRISASRDASGHVIEYLYDASGNLIQEIRRANIATNDPALYPVYVADTDHDAATYYYRDALGRVTATRDPESYVVETSYDAYGNTQSVVRRANRATNVAAAVVLPVTPPDVQRDATTTFAYNRLGRVKSVTDAESKTESYTLDAFGNRLTVTNELSGVTTNVYDHRGLLIRETKAITWDRGGNPQGATRGAVGRGGGCARARRRVREDRRLLHSGRVRRQRAARAGVERRGPGRRDGHRAPVAVRLRGGGGGRVGRRRRRLGRRRTGAELGGERPLQRGGEEPADRRRLRRHHLD